MRAFLESFFHNICQFPDTSVQELDKDLYLCTSKELVKYSHQAQFLEQVLMGYGLNNVLTMRANSKGEAEVIIDFGAKHHEKLQESSQKFLKEVKNYWWETHLDAYASLVHRQGKFTTHDKFAGMLLLGMNYNRAKRSFTCLAEITPTDNFILTFKDVKQPTVLYGHCQNPGIKIKLNSTHSNFYYKLAKPIMSAFYNSCETSWNIGVDLDQGLLLTDQGEFTLSDLTPQTSRIVTSSTRQLTTKARLKDILVQALKD